MNEFNVKTPHEWKENLYRKTTEKKVIKLKPAVLIAAIIAFVICISGSAFAVRVSRAPEYFGSKYLGQSESSDQVYSEKNLMLKSDREDLELVCKGIVGDNYNLFIVFHLKSTGDITFSENKSYWIDNIDERIPFTWGYGKGGNCQYLDEHTLVIELAYSFDGNSIVGRSIEMSFADIIEYEYNSFNVVRTIDCGFEGKIPVDYSSTNRKLRKTDNIVEMNSCKFIPVEAEISNLNLSYKLKLTEGEEAFNNTPDHKLLECTITLNYKDGTKESFNTRMPPSGENDIGVGYCGKRNGILSVNPHFSRSINASEVASVELNGVEVFVAR